MVSESPNGAANYQQVAFPNVYLVGRIVILFYNDACLALLGIRHSKTLGKPAAEVWQDNWSDLQALVETVIGQGEAVCREEVLCFIEKDNLKAETYLNFSYSPVFDGNNCAGGLCGLVKDVTPEVISRRRLETLHALSENSLAELKTVKEACQTTREILTKNLHDLPCAFIYLLDEMGKTAHLWESDALTSTAKLIPQAIALDNKKADFWNFNKILATDQLPVIHDFAKTSDKIPALPWQEEWIRQAIVLPLPQAGLPAKPMGFLVTGISPLLDFNLDYQ
ncbi:MAG: PAS domain-containing protein [Saprospiraceae bacterium]